MPRRTLHHALASAVATVALVASALVMAPTAAAAAPVDGAVLAAGANADGQLGSGTPGVPPSASSFQPVVGADVGHPVLDQVVFLDGGDAHSVAIDETGRLLTWGDNGRGQLGRSTGGPDSGTPAAVAGTSVLDADAGRDHTVWVADTSNRPAIAVGDNREGEAGGLTPGSSSTPQPVRYRLSATSLLQPLEGVSRAAAGASTSYFVTDDSVWALGDNRQGQLGIGVIGVAFNPVATQVVNLPSGIADVAAGDGFAVALTEFGDVWTWGANDLGQLGRDANVISPSPAPVPGLAGIDAIAAGDDHVLALDIDTGTVHAWGSNVDGQLGISDVSATNNTIELPGADLVAAGASHSIARQRDGATTTLTTWGADGAGQLARSGGSLPATVADVAGIAAVGAGGSHSLVAVAPTVRIDPAAADFGSIDVGAQTAPVTFTFTNDGPGRATIDSVAVDNSIEFPILGATTTCEAGLELAPDQSCGIDVAFAPTALGTRGSGADPFATLTVASDAVNGAMSVPLTGVGTLTPGAVSVTVDPPTVPASPDRVPSDLIPWSATSPDVETAPGSIGLNGMLLSPGSIGLNGMLLSPGSIGLNGQLLSPGSIGLNGMLLSPGSIGLNGQLLSPGSIGLNGMLLSPLGADVLESVHLAQFEVPGTTWYDLIPELTDPLRPLHEVSLAEAFLSYPDVFETLTLGDLDFPSSPLGSITVGGALTGRTPLIAYPSVAADPDAACAFLEDAGYPDCGAALEMTDDPALAPLKGLTASLLLLDVARVSYGDLVDLDTTLIAEVAEAFGGEITVTVDNTQYDLAYGGAGVVSMSAIGLPWNQTSLGLLTVADVPTEVRCDFFDCGHPAITDDLTIAEAASSSALEADATLDMLFDADLGDTTVADVLLATLLTGERPTHAVSLDSLVRRGLALAGETENPATYTALWDNEGAADLTDVVLSLDLHESVWPLANSAEVVVAGAPAAHQISSSRVGDRIRIDFLVDVIPAGETAAASIDVLGGPREGTVSARADGTAHSGALPVERSSNGPVILGVTPNFEPNDTLDQIGPSNVLALRDADADVEAQTRPAGTPLDGGGELALNQVSFGGDVDWFAVPAVDSDGDPVDLIEITNSQKDGSQVVALYYPLTSVHEDPLRATDGPVRHLDTVRELGNALTATDQPLDPGVRPALPGDGLGLRLADFVATGSTASDLLVANVPPQRAVEAGDPWYAPYFLLAVTASAEADISAGVSGLSAQAKQAHLGSVPTGTDLGECAAPLPRTSGETFGWPTANDAASADDIYLLDSAALRAEDPAGMAALATSFDAMAADGALGSFVIADLAANQALADELAAHVGDRCDVDATNDLVRAINDELDALAAPQAGRSILGGINSVPMGLVRDPSPISSGSELTYAAVAAAEGGDVELVSAYAAARYPTDAPYSATEVFAVRGTFFYPRTLPVARQLGTASELASALDALIAAGGVYSVQSANAVSTDWMTDLGAAVADALSESGVSVGTEQHDQSVTGQDVLDSLGGVDVHVGGLHGSSTGLFASDGSPISAADLRAAAATASLDLAMGPYCHVGTPVSSADGVARAFSSLASNSVLNTTYGIGVADANVLSGRILERVADLIDEVANPAELLNRAIGDAFLMDLDYGIYAPKVAMGATPYGLTAWRNGDVIENDEQATAPVVVDPISGVEYYDVGVAAGADRVRVDTDFGSYWSIDGATTSRSGGPIQPVFSVPVPNDATGALWIAGSETLLPATDLAHQTNQLAAGPDALVENDAVGSQGPTAQIRRSGDRAALTMRAGYATDLRRDGPRVVGDEHLVDDATFQVFRGDPAAVAQARPSAIETVRIAPDHVALEIEFDPGTAPAADAARVVAVVDDSVGDLDFVELIEVAPATDGNGVPLPDQPTRFAGISEVTPGQSVLALLQTVSASGGVEQLGPYPVIEENVSPIGYEFEVLGQQTPTGAYQDPKVQLTPADPATVLEYAIGDGAYQRYLGAFDLDGPDTLFAVRVRSTDNAVAGHHWVHKEGIGNGDGAGPVVATFPVPGSDFLINELVDGAVLCQDANGVDSGTITFTRTGETAPFATVAINGEYTEFVVPTQHAGFVRMDVTCVDSNGNESSAVVVYRNRFDTSNGFDAPLENLPAVNQANAGSTVRVQFSLLDAHGDEVGEVADVRFVATYLDPGSDCQSGCEDVETRGYKRLRKAGDKLVLEVESDKDWEGQRRTLVVTLVDNTTMQAALEFV